MRTVRAVPLADKGLIPTGPDNPVRWYLEDADTGRVIDTWGHADPAVVEARADAQGWAVLDRMRPCAGKD